MQRTTIDVDALLAFHRATFGAARMEDKTDDDSGDGKKADDDKGDGKKDDEADDEGDEGDEGDDEGADALGDAGKQALDRIKAKHKAERDRRKALEAENATLKAAKPKAGDEDKVDEDAIRAEADTAAQTKANARILRSEVKVAAAGKLADPADAYKFLDLDQFEVDADGNVDEDEIAEAIDDLLKTKPYLAAVQDGKRFKGGADGGTRKESRPAQLTRAALAGMSAQEITKARRDGRLKDLLAGKSK